MGDWVGGWVGSPPRRRSVVWDPIRGARRSAAPRARAFGRPRVQLIQSSGSGSKTEARATKVFHSLSRECLSVCVFSEGTRRRARARPRPPTNQPNEPTNLPTNQRECVRFDLAPAGARPRARGAARRGAATHNNNPKEVLRTLNSNRYPAAGRVVARCGSIDGVPEVTVRSPRARSLVCGETTRTGAAEGWLVGRGAHA